MEIASEIASEWLLYLLLLGSVFTLCVGLLFVVAPTHAIRFSQRSSGWHSVRQQTRMLDISRGDDLFFYRHHRLFGLFVLMGAAYILYRLGFDYTHHHIGAVLASWLGNTHLAEWLLEVFLWFSVPIAFVLLVFGGILAVRPSVLKKFETQANVWVSTRQALKSVEKQHIEVDLWVLHRPRLFGWGVTLGSLYVLLMLISFTAG